MGTRLFVERAYRLGLLLCLLLDVAIAQHTPSSLAIGLSLVPDTARPSRLTELRAVSGLHASPYANHPNGQRDPWEFTTDERADPLAAGSFPLGLRVVSIDSATTACAAHRVELEIIDLERPGHPSVRRARLFLPDVALLGGATINLSLGRGTFIANAPTRTSLHGEVNPHQDDRSLRLEGSHALICDLGYAVCEIANVRANQPLTDAVRANRLLTRLLHDTFGEDRFISWGGSFGAGVSLLEACEDHRRVMRGEPRVYSGYVVSGVPTDFGSFLNVTRFLDISRSLLHGQGTRRLADPGIDQLLQLKMEAGLEGAPLESLYSVAKNPPPGRFVMANGGSDWVTLWGDGAAFSKLAQHAGLARSYRTLPFAHAGHGGLPILNAKVDLWASFEALEDPLRSLEDYRASAARMKSLAPSSGESFFERFHPVNKGAELIPRWSHGRGTPTFIDPCLVKYQADGALEGVVSASLGGKLCAMRAVSGVMTTMSSLVLGPIPGQIVPLDLKGGDQRLLIGDETGLSEVAVSRDSKLTVLHRWPVSHVRRVAYHPGLGSGGAALAFTAAGDMVCVDLATRQVAASIAVGAVASSFVRGDHLYLAKPTGHLSKIAFHRDDAFGLVGVEVKNSPFLGLSPTVMVEHNATTLLVSGVYSTTPGNSDLIVLDAQDLEIVSRMTLPTPTVDFLEPLSSASVLVGSTNRIYEVSLNGGAVTPWSLDGSAGLTLADLDGDGNKDVVTLGLDGSVRVVDAGGVGLMQVPGFDGPSHALSVVAGQGQAEVYILERHEKIQRLDAATGAVLGTVPHPKTSQFFPRSLVVRHGALGPVFEAYEHGSAPLLLSGVSMEASVKCGQLILHEAGSESLLSHGPLALLGHFVDAEHIAQLCATYESGARYLQAGDPDANTLSFGQLYSEQPEPGAFVFTDVIVVGDVSIDPLATIGFGTGTLFAATPNGTLGRVDVTQNGLELTTHEVLGKGSCLATVDRNEDGVPELLTGSLLGTPDVPARLRILDGLSQQPLAELLTIGAVSGMAVLEDLVLARDFAVVGTFAGNLEVYELPATGEPILVTRAALGVLAPGLFDTLRVVPRAGEPPLIIVGTGGSIEAFELVLDPTQATPKTAASRTGAK